MQRHPGQTVSAASPLGAFWLVAIGFALVVAVLLVLTGCGSTDKYGAQEPVLGCGAGQAQILVQDGFLKNLCGCQEAAGTVAVQGQSLTCTVSAGTQVSFNYAGTQIRHQIISSSTPEGFPASGLGVPSHVVRFSSIGTFPFRDQFNTLLAGQIVVN